MSYTVDRGRIIVRGTRCVECQTLQEALELLNMVTKYSSFYSPFVLKFAFLHLFLPSSNLHRVSIPILLLELCKGGDELSVNGDVQGLAARRVGGHQMNEASSRSHTLLSLLITSFPPGESMLSSY